MDLQNKLQSSASLGCPRYLLPRSMWNRGYLLASQHKAYIRGPILCGMALLLKLACLPLFLLHWPFRVVAYLQLSSKHAKLIKKIQRAIAQHQKPFGHVMPLWDRYNPASMGMSGMNEIKTLSAWMTILYGKSLDEWNHQLNDTQSQLHKPMINNRRALLEGETSIHWFYSANSFSAQRVLKKLQDRIPAQYLQHH